MRTLENLTRSGLALLALALLALGGLATVAKADEAADSASSLSFAPAASSLPTFAQAPSTPSSPWTGLTIGTDLSVTGGKGVKGGIGGDAYLGYNRELSNNLVIGVQAVSGYAPSLSRYSRVNGFDYAGANVKVGYDMGRFMPYLTAGVGFAKANFGPPGRYDTSDSLDDLFNKGGGPLATTTTVGAGFDYAITNNFKMGLSVSTTQYNGGPVSPFLP